MWNYFKSSGIMAGMGVAAIAAQQRIKGSWKGLVACGKFPWKGQWWYRVKGGEGKPLTYQL